MTSGIQYVLSRNHTVSAIISRLYQLGRFISLALIHIAHPYCIHYYDYMSIHIAPSTNLSLKLVSAQHFIVVGVITCSYYVVISCLTRKEGKKNRSESSTPQLEHFVNTSTFPLSVYWSHLTVTNWCNIEPIVQTELCGLTNVHVYPLGRVIYSALPRFSDQHDQGIENIMVFSTTTTNCNIKFPRSVLHGEHGNAFSQVADVLWGAVK